MCKSSRLVCNVTIQIRASLCCLFSLFSLHLCSVFSDCHSVKLTSIQSLALARLISLSCANHIGFPTQSPQTLSAPSTEMEDSVSNMFADPFGHSFNDLFNQYVNMDSSADDHRDLSLSSDLDQIFPLDPMSNGCGDRSPYVPTSNQPAPQLCSKEAWCLQQDAVSPACPRGFVLNDSPHPVAVSGVSPNQGAPSRPAAVHRPLSTSLSTPPATPRRSRGAKGVKTTPKPILHRNSSDQTDLRHKQSFSPSLTGSSQMHGSKMAFADPWNSRIPNFNAHASNDRLPLSPPPSDIIMQRENIPTDSTPQMNRSGDAQYESNMFSQSPAVSMPSPSSDPLARHQQRYMAHLSNSGLPNQRPPSPDAIYSSSSSEHQPMSSWQSGSLGASAFSFPSDFHNHDARSWWSSTGSRMPEQQTAMHQSMVASSTPPSPYQNAQNSGSPNGMMHGGLMIQFDPSVGMPATTGSSSFSSSSMHSAAASQESLPFSNPETSAGSHQFVDASSFTTPMVHDPNPPRSPSLSPNLPASPKDMRNGTPTKSHHRRNHSRKLSSISMNSPKPATSPKGHGKSASVSFVNYTPSDSRRILTGVAPSGSSKTKARREQEARDRRRKLGEAALHAVRDAGGDVEALEAVLC